MTSPQRLSPAERRQKNRAEMAQAILEVAREVMREEGVAALNLNEVARRLKLKPPSLYKYFPGKAAIYDELFRLAHQMFLEQVTAKVHAQSGDFWETWTTVLEAQLEFAHAYPELFDLAFQRPVPGFTPSEVSMACSRASAEQGEAIIRKAMESGEIVTNLSLEQVRDLLFALTGGLTAAHLANEPGLPPDQGRFGSLARQAMQVFRAAWGMSDLNKNQELVHQGGD